MFDLSLENAYLQKVNGVVLGHWSVYLTILDTKNRFMVCGLRVNEWQTRLTVP